MGLLTWLKARAEMEEAKRALPDPPIENPERIQLLEPYLVHRSPCEAARHARADCSCGLRQTLMDLKSEMDWLSTKGTMGIIT